MKLRSIHYELTDLCNAGCPQCIRTDVDGCTPHKWLLGAACTLAEFRRLSPPELLSEIDYAFFCGNFGDPAVVPELIDILRYGWQANPKLRLALHTNASLRKTEWWVELARAARERRFMVVAGIDGASQETNSRYRVRTDFARIMANLSAFIAEGGKAEWRMIVFRHNEHEVETARQMAEQMGFVGFRAYPSDRFGKQDAAPYEYKGETFVLEPPTGSYAPKSANTHEIAHRDLPTTEAVIDCMSLATSSAFVDFRGYLLPCCHIGRKLYQRDRGSLPEAESTVREVLDGFDMERLNVETAGFAGARAGLDAFLAYLEPHWARQRPLICKAICGKRAPRHPDV